MAGLENNNAGTGINTSGFDLSGGFGTTGGLTTTTPIAQQTPDFSTSGGETFGVQTPDLPPSLSPESVDQRASTMADLTSTTQESSSVGGDFADAAIGAGEDILNSYLVNLRTAAENNYKQDAAEWSNKRKGWFDPNLDVIPTLSEYLKGIPDPTEVLTKSTLSGGEVSSSTDGATLGVLTLGLSAAFDDQEQAEYIWNKGGEGALGGAVSGGWVGAIVGGLVGVLEGALGWADAEDQSEKEIRKRTDEYQEKYDRWLSQRKKRKAAAVTAQTQLGLERRQADKQVQGVSKKAGIIGAVDAFSKGVIR